MFLIHEDEEIDIGEPRRPRWIRERNNFFDDYDDVDFVTRFRLSKTSFLNVLQEIEDRLEYPSER